MKPHINTLIIALAVLLGAFWLNTTLKKKYTSNETIYVTGLGEKDFTSDLIVWSGNFSKLNYELSKAYEALNKDRETIRLYLNNKGIDPKEMVFSSVDIQKEFENIFDDKGNRSSKFIGYSLRQSVNIESSDVDKIEAISREVTELINQGVEFSSNAPQYYYTKLGELKIEMVAEATKDARVRADQIAENSGAKLGELKNANMGIFQIIGQNSSEDYSWGGSYNTSSKRKTATITMRLQFGIE